MSNKMNGKEVPKYGKQNRSHGNGNNRRWKNKSDTVRDSDRSVTKESEVKYNDPSWYKLNDQIAHDVASFSFGKALGSGFSLGTGNSYQIKYVNAIPGTYSIYTIPAIGEAMTETSPVNIAMNSLFRNLRKGNTGSQVYDQPDLMMYIFAMDSVYSWYATLCRLYGLGRTYSYYNRYYADGVTLAQNFDPSVLANLSWLRGYINQLAVKINQFAVPNSIKYFARHYWMYSSMWLDGDNAKSQVYLYVPQALYKYDETSGAGRLDLFDVCGTVNATNGCVPRTPLTEQNIINITNTLLDPLIKSQDINTISGDVVKFWGDQLWQVAGIEDNYTIIPRYAEEVLNQIHNTTFTGNGLLDSNAITSAFGYGSCAITQQIGINQGYLVCTPAFKFNNAAAYEKFLDFKIDSPTPDDVLVATRNMNIMGTQQYDSTNDIYVGTLTNMGSDICMYHVTGRWNPGAGMFMFTVEAERAAMVLSSNIALLERLSYFDWAPLYYRTDAQTYHHLVAVHGDLQNYRVMSYEDLATIHRGAILAMLNLEESLK